MKNKHSRNLILNYLMLNFLGLLMIYSTTFKINIIAGTSGFASFFKQLIIILLIIIGSLIVIRNERKFSLSKYVDNSIDYLFYGSLVLLLLVFPLGHEAGGAKSVINIFIFDLQPIEIYKITMILYLAKWLNNNPTADFKNYCIHALVIPAIGIGLIILEPDFGGALILIAVLVIMLLIYGKFSKKLLQIGLGLALVIGLLFANFGHTYQLARFSYFLNPFKDLSGDGMNIVQSFVSISNGGIGGVGFTNSLQKTGYLFGSNTDFIFSIICEEFGLIGAVVTIGLLLWLVFQIYRTGKRSGLMFEYLYCSGLSTLILIQTFINIGGVTGIIPMTGVTLPFISYGFNSFLFLSFGLLYVYLIEKKTITTKNKKRIA